VEKRYYLGKTGMARQMETESHHKEEREEIVRQAQSRWSSPAEEMEIDTPPVSEAELRSLEATFQNLTVESSPPTV